MTSARTRSREVTGILVAEVRPADLGDARGIRGHGKRHGVVGILLGHGARRNDDDLVCIGRRGDVGFRTGDDDFILGFVNDPNVIVGAALLARPLGPVAFYIGDGARQGEIVDRAMPAILCDAVQVRLIARNPGHSRDRIHDVGADVFHEREGAVRHTACSLDQLVPLGDGLRVVGDLEIPAYLLAGAWLLHDGELVHVWMIRQQEIKRGGFNADLDVGILGDIGNFVSKNVNLAVVSQSCLVFVSGSKCHRL